MRCVLKRTSRFTSFDAQVAPRRVVVLGATGYLGQFLVIHLSNHFAESVVGLRSADADFEGPFEPFKARLRELGPIEVIINCAALSIPGDCAKDPAKADAVNVPRHLVRYLEEMGVDRPLLVHLSTDQVYDGSHGMWSETDQCHPVNVYGSTKLASEEFIRAHLPNYYAILRSSIILGPQAPLKPLSRALFTDFVIGSLENPDKPASFFSDEWRCPVSVYDIADVIKSLWFQRNRLKERGEVFNMGGSARVSREEMARTIARVFKLDESRIEAVSASTVKRGVASPGDISMDSSKLETFIGFKLVPLETSVKQIFHVSKAS